MTLKRTAPTRGSLRRQKSTKREALAYTLRKQGKKLREIGEVLGVSAEQARICVRRGERTASAPSLLWELTSRSRRGIAITLGTDVEHEMLSLLKQNGLDIAAVKQIPNTSHRTARELEQWAEKHGIACR